jgi:hypothetical protein
MPEPDLTRGFTDEHRAKFFAYLDRLPARDRPVYGFAGQQPSAWQWLGGGTTYVLVLFFPDHVVFSTRRMNNHRESGRTTRLLAEITSIEVAPGPLRSSAVILFVDEKSMKLSGIAPAAAAPLARFADADLAAFDRAELTPEAVRAFFVACSRGLPLPDGLFTDLA